MKSLLKNIFVFLLASTVTFVAEPACAVPNTYSFTGEITDISGSLPYVFTVGDLVTGSIIYDPEQSLNNGMSVVIGDITIQSVGDASLQVINNGVGGDNINVYFTPISVNGQQQTSGSHAMLFSLTDTTGAVFSDTTLPTALDFQKFDERIGAVFAGFGNTVVFSINPAPEDPGDIVRALVKKIVDINIDNNMSNAIDDKFNAALAALDDTNEHNDVAAVNSLYALIYSTEAQRGTVLTETEADAIIEATQTTIDALMAQ